MTVDQGPTVTRGRCSRRARVWIQAETGDPEPGAARVAPAAGRRPGWGAPSWPTEWCGRGLPGVGRRGRRPPSWPPPARSARRSAAASGLAAPTILEHGPDDLQGRLLRPIVTGEDTWCQLFSEPGTGSDLAGLDHARRARRRRVGRQRPEGVEHQRPPRRLRHAPGPHRLGRAQAPRASPTSCCRCTSPASRSARCGR